MKALFTIDVPSQSAPTISVPRWICLAVWTVFIAIYTSRRHKADRHIKAYFDARLGGDPRQL
jgi:hypothetical protein